LFDRSGLAPTPPDALSGQELRRELLHIASGLSGRERPLVERAAWLAVDRDRLLEALRFRVEHFDARRGSGRWDQGAGSSGKGS
jgi:hypothetical protein